MGADIFLAVVARDVLYYTNMAKKFMTTARQLSWCSDFGYDIVA